MQSTDFNDITLPSHYQFEGEITEVRDVIRDRTVQYVEAGLPLEGLYDYLNAIKYTLRAPGKNGIEDFKKASYCLDSLIEILEDDAELYGSGRVTPDMALILNQLSKAAGDSKDDMTFRVRSHGTWRNPVDMAKMPGPADA